MSIYNEAAALQRVQYSVMFVIIELVCILNKKLDFYLIYPYVQI